MAAAAPLIASVIKGVVVGGLISGFFRLIFGDDKPDPIKAPIRPTKAERGSQIPLLIGRDRLAPVVIGEYDREVRIERNSTAGGKGVGAAGGASLDNEVVYARFLMAVCVGPAERLREITYNGERIWPVGDEFSRGVVPHGWPSGTEFETQGDPAVGPFQIYWGEVDQPVPTGVFGGNNFPVETKLPYVCYLYWPDFRLGGQGTLGQMQIDIEARPFQAGSTHAAHSVGTTYENIVAANGSSLGGTSSPWFRNGVAIDEDNPHRVLRYLENSDEIKLAGDLTLDFPPGSFIALRYPGAADQFGLVGDQPGDVSYNASEQTTVQNSDSTVRLISPDIAGSWAVSGDPAVSVTSYGFYPPGVDGQGGTAQSWTLGYSAGASGRFLIAQTSPLAGGYIPPGGFDEQDAGTGFNVFSVYVLSEGQTESLEVRIGETSGGTKQGIVNFRLENSAVSVQSITGAGGTTARVVRQGLSNWYLCEVYMEAGGTSNTLLADDTLTVQLWVTPVSIIRVCLQGGAAPLNGQAGLQFSTSSLVTGITTLKTDLQIDGFTDGLGNVYSYAADENGEAGANAAHAIYQLLFEEDPHGLGMDPAYWDLTSLQTMGDELEAEGLRTHLILEERQTVKEKISNLLLEVGIDVAWDVVQGKYVFSLRRETVPDAVVPERMLRGPLISKSRRLEPANAKSFVFSFVVAEENYTVRSVEADDVGNVAIAERSGTEIDSLRTPRDIQTGQVIAARRALEEQALLSLTSFSLKTDAVTLRSNDVIDVSAILGDTQPYRISSVEFQPKSRQVTVNCYPDALQGTATSASRGPGFLSAAPEALTADASGLILETDGGIVGLRIPTDSRAVYGIILSSEDGLSFWATGITTASGGGAWVDTTGTSILFKAPVASFTQSIEPADSADPQSRVLMAATTKGEVFPLRSITDLGKGLFRLNDAFRESPIAMSSGDYIFVWRSGRVPSFAEGYSLSETREFKIVPASSGAIGSPAEAVGLQEIDVKSVPETLPAGGTKGQLLTKQSADDYDVAWEDPA